MTRGHFSRFHGFLISLFLSLFHVLPFSLSFSACIMQKIFIAPTSGVINSFLPFSRVYDGDIFFYRVSSFSSDPFHLLKLCLPATLSYGFFFPLCVDKRLHLNSSVILFFIPTVGAENFSDMQVYINLTAVLLVDHIFYK